MSLRFRRPGYALGLPHKPYATGGIGIVPLYVIIELVGERFVGPVMLVGEQIWNVDLVGETLFDEVDFDGLIDVPDDFIAEGQRSPKDIAILGSRDQVLPNTGRRPARNLDIDGEHDPS